MRPILDNTHYQRIDPPSREIQSDLQTEKLRFRVLRNHGRVDCTVIRPKRTTSRHEQDLLNPELDLVLITNCNMVADSDAAPQHT